MSGKSSVSSASVSVSEIVETSLSAAGAVVSAVVSSAGFSEHEANVGRSTDSVMRTRRSFLEREFFHKIHRFLCLILFKTNTIDIAIISFQHMAVNKVW